MEVKLQQILTQDWKTESGQARFNLYGLGVDGSVYKKIGNDGRGWIKLNMTMEFVEENQKQ